MTNNDKNRKVAQELSDAEAERLLYQTLLELGWLVPQTMAEVERAEKRLGQTPIELPSVLQDPFAVLDDKVPNRSPVLPTPTIDQTTVENLACAARNGGDVPPEIQALMERDRKRAELERDDGWQ
jgi:hypothetical protein